MPRDLIKRAGSRAAAVEFDQLRLEGHAANSKSLYRRVQTQACV